MSAFAIIVEVEDGTKELPGVLIIDVLLIKWYFFPHRHAAGLQFTVLPPILLVKVASFLCPDFLWLHVALS